MMTGKILLVEDNQDDIFLTLRAFGKSNIANQIDVVNDGVEALEYLEKNPAPAIILLDLNMPRLDGIPCLQRIRANEKTKLIPVIILTSSAEDQDLIAGYAAGVNSFITKPVDTSQFMEAIKTLGVYWLVLNRQHIRR